MKERSTKLLKENTQGMNKSNVNKNEDSCNINVIFNLLILKKSCVIIVCVKIDFKVK